MSSCNGCRALRKGCSDSCILRPCLDWIPSSSAQSHATLFVARFFGRSDLMSFVSSVPPPHRAALFQSLLYEACGRTVNPVSGAVGLLSTGNWHLCQIAVETILAGGVVQANPGLSAGVLPHTVSGDPRFSNRIRMEAVERARAAAALSAERSGATTMGSANDWVKISEEGTEQHKLLNLFV